MKQYNQDIALTEPRINPDKEYDDIVSIADDLRADLENSIAGAAEIDVTLKTGIITVTIRVIAPESANKRLVQNAIQTIAHELHEEVLK